MNPSKYDHLLEQVNSRQTREQRLLKLQEECIELALEISHLLDGRQVETGIEQEMADVLITMRSAMLVLREDTVTDVPRWMELKAQRLHQRYLEGTL